MQRNYTDRNIIQGDALGIGGFVALLIKKVAGGLRLRDHADAADVGLVARDLTLTGDTLDLGAESAAPVRLARSAQTASGYTIKLPPGPPAKGQVLAAVDAADDIAWLAWETLWPQGATGERVTTALSHNASQEVALLTLPPAVAIGSIRVVIDQPFNGSPSLSIGTAEHHSLFLGAPSVDLTQPAGTTMDDSPGIAPADTALAVVGYYVANGATAGAARIIVDLEGGQAQASGNDDSAGLGSAAYHDVPKSGNATADEVVLGADSRLSDSRTPAAHSHAVGDTTGLQQALDAKATASHQHQNTLADVGITGIGYPQATRVDGSDRLLLERAGGPAAVEVDMLIKRAVVELDCSTASAIVIGPNAVRSGLLSAGLWELQADAPCYFTLGAAPTASTGVGSVFLGANETRIIRLGAQSRISAIHFQGSDLGTGCLLRLTPVVSVS